MVTDVEVLTVWFAIRQVVDAAERLWCDLCSGKLGASAAIDIIHTEDPENEAVRHEFVALFLSRVRDAGRAVAEADSVPTMVTSGTNSAPNSASTTPVRPRGQSPVTQPGSLNESDFPSLGHPGPTLSLLSDIPLLLKSDPLSTR